MMPHNRHVIVSPVLNKEEERTNEILLPDGFTTEPEYSIVEVVELAQDCKVDVLPGERIVVLNSMIQKINVENFDLHMVLENHIMCTL